MKRETLALHHGYAPDDQHSVAVPIHQTTSFSFDDAQHAADLFDLKVEGNIYSRIMNPTCAVLENRVAALEGGIAGLAVASGMAAITYTIQTLAESGDNIVSISELYGGTYNLFAHTLPRQGIEVRFADKDDLAGIADRIDERTKAVFCESIGNPSGSVVDIAALAEVAHDNGVPLIVDNTVATPFLWRPIEHGADIVVHSATKYIGGHGTTVGGVIVDSGRFPWASHAERFALLNEPDPSYHGISYTRDVGDAAFIARARVVPLRNMGGPQRPGRLESAAGSRDIGAAHRAHLCQHPDHSRVPRGPRGGVLGQVRWPFTSQGPRVGQTLHGGPGLRHLELRHQGRTRRRGALLRRARADPALGQYR